MWEELVMHKILDGTSLSKPVACEVKKEEKDEEEGMLLSCELAGIDDQLFRHLHQGPH